MAKLKRSALMHFVDTTFGGLSPSWYLIGKDVTDLSIELNPEIEQVTNILDETSTNHTGYTASADVDTYYADPEDGDFYTKMLDIAMGRKSGDACKTTYLEIIIDGSSTNKAYTEDVLLVPTSYGGETGGVRIPYTINFTGNHKDGTATISNGTPSFSPTTSSGGSGSGGSGSGGSGSGGSGSGGSGVS